MTKQSTTSTRRRRRVLLGTAASGLVLAGIFGVMAGTPSATPDAAVAPEDIAGAPATTEPAAGPSTDSPADPSADPSAGPSAGASTDPSAGSPSADPSAEGDPAPETVPETVPEISSAVGVAPARPAADDAELALTPQKENDAVELDQKVQVVDGMTVEISGLAAVDGVADEPGEVSGDAVKVSVTLTNTSSTAADTSGVVVDLEAGADALPGVALQGPGSTFPATISPGESATADYVFVVEADQRARVSVLVNYTATAPVVVFEGAAPTAEGKS